MALAGPQIYFGHEARHYAQAATLLLLTALAAWLAAWGPQFWRQLDDGFATTSWIPVNERPVLDWLGHVVALPLMTTVFTKGLPVAVLVGSWVLVALGVARGWPVGPLPAERRVWLWAGYFVAGVLPAALLELIGGREVLAYPRYTVFAAPGLFALAATVLAGHPRRWLRHAVGAGVLLMATVELTRPYVMPFPDYAPLGRFVSERAEDGDAVVLTREARVWVHTGTYRALSRYVEADLGPLLIVDDGGEVGAAGVPGGRAWVLTVSGGRATVPADWRPVLTEGFPPLGTARLYEVPSEVPSEVPAAGP